MSVRRVALAIAALALPACAGTGMLDEARAAAARDHACPESRVQMHSDASSSNDYAYWLDVCGQLRLYAYQRTGSANRFVDVSQRASSGSP